MKKLVNFVAGFCGVIVFGGVLTIGLSLSSCSNRTTMPAAPSVNQVFRAKDIPPDAVTICGGYVVSAGCSGESMCPPVDNSGAGGSCTIYAIITPPTTPVPTNTPTFVPTPTGTVPPSPSVTQSPIPSPPTNTPTIPATDTPTFTDTPTPIPTNTFTPTIPPTPSFTPTPNAACIQCEIDYAEKRGEIANDTADEIATGYEFCQNSCLGIEQCLGICDLLDETVATIKQSAEILVAVVEHNKCLTDNKCP